MWNRFMFSEADIHMTTVWFDWRMESTVDVTSGLVKVEAMHGCCVALWRWDRSGCCSGRSDLINWFELVCVEVSQKVYQ